MFMQIKWLVGAVCLASMSGCSGIMQYVEKLQAQPIDDLSQRSTYFRPQYRLEQPHRASLTPEEQQLIGAPPPSQGEIVLDGTRYYSANGYICQYFKDAKVTPETNIRSACFINGRWQAAISVLNTLPVQP